MTIVEGLPAGLAIDFDAITLELRRRQGGYGRGRRMVIETDRAEILSGVRRGKTTGAPVTLLVRNKDWENWQNTMHAEPQAPTGSTGANRAAVVRPRPGHADLAGALKYDHDDIRDVLERASARETAARVAAGSLARQLLNAVGCEITSHITGIGNVVVTDTAVVPFDAARALAPEAPLRCVDTELEKQMMAAIDAAKEAGDTLGGSFEVIVRNLPIGLGSYVQWDRKLDGRLAQAVMSIQAIKAVSIGDGVDGARRPGSRVHDEIVADSHAAPGDPVIIRPTNRAGGLEGGVTNGEELRVTGYMKPISTLMKPLRSVDLTTLEDAPAAIERSDTCAVPAAAVVAEAMVALVLADALIERFGGDSMLDLRERVTTTGTKIRGRVSRRPATAQA